MKKIKNTFYVFLTILFAGLLSCNNQEGIMKSITGKPGEMIIVMSDASWDGKPGQLLRETMAQQHIALPQDEPLFDIVKLTPESFQSIFRTTRNIIQTRISSTIEQSGVNFRNDIWASPQATVQINAKNEKEFEELFNENKNKILSYFLKAEKDRLTGNYRKFYERGIFNALDKKFDIAMNIAPGFQIATENKDFIWLRFETPEISQGIIIYTYPFVSDSAFMPEYQMNVRDHFLKSFVPGPAEGSYMTTERQIDQFSNIIQHNGNYAAEMRGLWKLVNDFMGGPYISLSELDLANQRIITAYGYIYAPSKNKRNYIRQLEAMLYSLKLNNQEENDILNRQQIEIDVTAES